MTNLTIGRLGTPSATPANFDVPESRLSNWQLAVNQASLKPGQIPNARPSIQLLEDAGPSAPPTLTPPLISQDQIKSIQQNALSAFLQFAATQPDGSDLKIVYNLYKVLAIQAEVPQLAGNVNATGAENDLQTYLQKPDVQAVVRQYIDSATPGVTGQNSSDIVSNLSTWLLSNAQALQTLRQTNPDQANSIVNEVIGQVAFFDPAAAKTLLTQYIQATVNPADPFPTIANSDINILVRAAQDTFQIGVTESRFGAGALSSAFKSLSFLSSTELQQAASAYATALQQAARLNPSAAEMPSLVQVFLSMQPLDPTVSQALGDFAKKLGATGGFGLLSGALAIVAVVQDFTGEGTANVSTPWGRVVTAADIMSAVGGFSSLSALVGPIKGLYQMLSSPVAGLSEPAAAALQGIELTNAGAVANALQTNAAVMQALLAAGETPEQAAESVTEFATAVSQLASEASDPAEVLAGLSEYQSATSASQISLTSGLVSDPELGLELGSQVSLGSAGEITAAEAALEAEGLSASEAGTAVAEIGSVVDAGSVAAQGLSAGALVLKGLGALGSAANILYAANSVNNAITDFRNNDAVSGALDVASATGFTVGAAAGLGAAAAEAAAAFGAEGALIGAFTGPAAPIVAAVASVAGFAFALGRYFYQQHEESSQLADLQNFLKSGVGNGNSYYLESGSGSVIGDPHFTGALGQHYDVQGEAGNYYSLLTDKGIQVDALFQQYQGTSNNTIGEMGILLGSDKIDIGTGGSLTINGQAMGDGTYLNGEVTKSNGTITIQTPNYTIVVTDGGGYLDTNFTATGVGSAGVPGGLWGQSLNGENVDTNASDFQVANLWAPNTGGYGLGSASAMMAQLQEVLASDMALDASRNVVKSPS